ncbi:hypothetical protein Tco_0307580 [Tanacetum coccineum]
MQSLDVYYNFTNSPCRIINPSRWNYFAPYIDTRPNGDALRKCILKGPYQPTTVTISTVPATENSPAVPERTAVETILTMSPENKAHYESEKEAIHLLLTGIGDEIYSTVDACKTALKSPKSHKSFAPPSKQSSSTRSDASTKFKGKGKEIGKLITPPSESASEEDNDPEQAQRDKDMQLNLALIAKYFKKIYKPTNNNLKTSSNSSNKNVDTSPRQSAEKGVPLQAKQADWLEDTDEEIDEQELEAHYSFMAKIQEDNRNVTPDSPDMCDNDIQTDQNAEDEHATLANLIANLKLDVDENKKIQKQLKKANASLTHELKECKSVIAETSKTLGESNSIQDSCLVALQNKQTEFETYKALNDRTVYYDKIKLFKEKHDELVKQSLLTKSHFEGIVKEKTKVITDLKLKEEKDIDKMISMEKQLKFLNGIVYKRNQSIQTTHMLAPKGLTFNGRPTFANPMYLKKAQYEKPCLYEIPYDQSDPANRLVPVSLKIW